MDRRSFIKCGAGLWTLASASAAFGQILQGRGAGANSGQIPWKPNSRLKTPPRALLGLAVQNPIQDVLSTEFSSVDFNGDNINLPHDILWNVDGFIAEHGGLPQPELHVPALVVGGGMSGLLTQYFLTQNKKSILLEQDPILGGNSKGEKFAGMPYSTGAAYVTVPDEGSDIDLFFNEIGLRDSFRHEEASEVATFFKKELIKNFSSGLTAPGFKEQFEIVNARLNEILEKDYPEIPHRPDASMTRKQLNQLDRISFLDWLRALLGTEPHPHLLEYYQLYCWSSFTGSIDELSAAQVLNFVASEVSGVLALPGGNAQITSTLYKKLSQNPLSDIRSSSFVIDIRSVGDKVQVSYLNSEQKIVSLTANQVYVCCAKNVARRIIRNLPADQDKAFGDINFRGYVVANVLLNRKVASAGYDLYRPLCYDGARQFLFAPMAHEKNKKKVMDELETLLPALGLNSSDVVGVRMTRWGHSLPVAEKGWIASGQPEIVSRPIDDKIFFVNQDNWANPAFETCFSEARYWTSKR